jgi:hypothetical protein
MGVAQELADRKDLADVEPVVVALLVLLVNDTAFDLSQELLYKVAI